MATTPKIILLLLFLANIFQLVVLLFSGAYFPILVTRGFYPLDYRLELSQVSDGVWSLIEIINSFIGVTYLVGIVLNVVLVLVVFRSLNPSKWQIRSAYLSGLAPIVIILIGKIFFKPPVSESGFSDRGYSHKVYGYESEQSERSYIWRSEKCTDCYKENERIRWVLIERKEIKNGD